MEQLTVYAGKPVRDVEMDLSGLVSKD
jgi:hypothetical protein